jgi:hypothetical protein
VVILSEVPHVVAMALLQTEASRERLTVRIAAGAFVVAGLSGLFSFMQWRAADRAATVAEQARKDALAANAQQRLDAQEDLKRQQAESDKALKIQSDSAAEALQNSRPKCQGCGDERGSS